MTSWLVDKGHAADRTQAVHLGRAMVEALEIVHVCRDHDFKDKHLFFRFMSDSRDKGHVRRPDDGGPPKSWSMFLDNPENANKELSPHELK